MYKHHSAYSRWLAMLLSLSLLLSLAACAVLVAAADFNGDGRVNVRDARAILRQIAGLD